MYVWPGTHAHGVHARNPSKSNSIICLGGWLDLDLGSGASLRQWHTFNLRKSYHKNKEPSVLENGTWSMKRGRERKE